MAKEKRRGEGASGEVLSLEEVGAPAVRPPARTRQATVKKSLTSPSGGLNTSKGLVCRDKNVAAREAPLPKESRDANVREKKVV